MSDLNSLLIEASSTDSLSSMYEIENVLLLLDEINKKKEYYKELKRVRTRSIDDKISTLDSRSEVLRQVVLNTMKEAAPNEKTLDFPSIGKVTRRKPKASWSVDNEEVLLSFLDNEGQKEEVIKTVVSIDKRKLKLVLDTYSKTGTQIPGVSSVSTPEALTITFDKNKKTEVMSGVNERVEEVDLDVLDSLEV